MTAAILALRPRTTADDLESAWHNACQAYLFALFNAAPNEIVKQLGDDVMRSAFEYRRSIPQRYGYGPAVPA